MKGEEGEYEEDEDGEEGEYDADLLFELRVNPKPGTCKTKQKKKKKKVMKREAYYYMLDNASAKGKLYLVTRVSNLQTR